MYEIRQYKVRSDEIRSDKIREDKTRYDKKRQVVTIAALSTNEYFKGILLD